MAHRLMTAALFGAAFAALAAPAHAADIPNPMADSATWADLRGDVVGDASVRPAAGLFEVDLPYRADDGANVPIHITQTDPTLPIESAIVVIDENPSPVAAEFGFSQGMAPLDLQFRIRVNQYSNVRVIAGTPTGLRMGGRYVKASGGCSAPAGKDPEAALADIGGMLMKRAADAPAMSTIRREAEFSIQHPNFSGLQRDQVTQLFIPAQFIDHIEVWQGDERLFTMDGGISISENPSFRFSYTDNGATALTVKATDTGGNSFEQVLPKVAGG